MMTTYEKGWFAENLCVFFLRLKGYRILKRRWRTPLGEIDIVARRGATLVLVEVKHRPKVRHESLVLQRQRRRLERAAHYVLAHMETKCLNIRFDVMVVVPQRIIPYHFSGAWRPVSGGAF